MRIRRRPKHVVCTLEGEHSDRHVRLHVRDRTRIAQQAHQHCILLLSPDPRGVSDTCIEARDGDLVFQADGHACERALRVAALCGCLCLDEHDFGEAVRGLVRQQGCLSVRDDDVGGLECIALNASDYLGDRLCEDGLLGCGERCLVRLR